MAKHAMVAENITKFDALQRVHHPGHAPVMLVLIVVRASRHQLEWHQSGNRTQTFVLSLALSLTFNASPQHPLPRKLQFEYAC